MRSDIDISIEVELPRMMPGYEPGLIYLLVIIKVNKKLELKMKSLIVRAV